MCHKAFSLLLMVFVVLFSGCGPVSPSSVASIENVDANPVLVVMGGFSSCASGPSGWTPMNTRRWQRASRLSHQFAVNGEAYWLRSCWDRTGNIHFVSSRNYPNVTSVDLDGLSILRNMLSAEAGDNRPVYFVGHSHGGWLAMKLISAMGSRLNVKGLVTVDPISFSDCRPSHYLRAIAYPGTSSLAGCSRAPSAAATANVSRALENGTWRHFYQRNFIPLRSSAFNGSHRPDSSHDMSPFLSVSRGGAAASWNAHTGIDRLDSIWYMSEMMVQNGPR